MPAIDPTAREFLTIEGQQMGYLRAGVKGGPPLIMVHGWLSHAGVWVKTLETFASTHDCIAIDLLGHGFSDKPRNGDYSIAAQSRRVLAIADALGIQRFTWIGHSMGGQIGLYTAIHNPERLERLVSVSGVVTGQLSAYVRHRVQPIFWLGSLMPAVWNLSRMMSNWSWYKDYFDRPIVYSLPSGIPPVDRQMALQHGVEIPFYRDLQAIAACDLTPDLPKIQTPTLAIFGKQDNTVPVEHGYLLEQRVPGSRLVVFEECGHLPYQEQPTQYLNALQGFLTEPAYADRTAS